MHFKVIRSPYTEIYGFVIDTVLNYIQIQLRFSICWRLKHFSIEIFAMQSLQKNVRGPYSVVLFGVPGPLECSLRH